MNHIKFVIHPENPQRRLIDKAANILYQKGVIIYPTDAAYSIGCLMNNRSAIEKLRTICGMSPKKPLSLVCKDLSQLSQYARVDNSCYRLLKASTPGPYTFVLPAAKQVPKQATDTKNKTIGLRIPDNPIVSALLAEVGEPLLSATLRNADVENGEDYPIALVDELADKFRHQVDLIIDGGCCGIEPTTVLRLLDGIPEVVRQGKGSTASFFN